MISVSRSGVTATLALTRAQTALNGCIDADAPSYVGTRQYAWQSMQKRLSRAQRMKCAYCEDYLRERATEVDHIRPKGIYWWLAFQMENLVAACRTCNNAKADKWGVAASTVSLTPRQIPTATNEPHLLVHPVDDDPTVHIDFWKIEGRWRIRSLSPKGSWTIKALELDRTSFVEEANILAELVLEPEVARLKAAVASGDKLAFEESRRILLRHSSPDSRFSQFATRVIMDTLGS